MLTVWRLCLSVLILCSQRQRWKSQIALDVPNLFVLLSQENHLALPWAVSRGGSAHHNPIQPSFLASNILELKLITVRTNQGLWLHLLGRRFQNACSCSLVFFPHIISWQTLHWWSGKAYMTYIYNNEKSFDTKQEFSVWTSLTVWSWERTCYSLFLDVILSHSVGKNRNCCICHDWNFWYAPFFPAVLIF